MNGSQKIGCSILILTALFDLVQIDFIIRKIDGSITWSWLWVFSPLFILLGVMGLIVFAAVIYVIIKSFKNQK